MRVKFGDLNVTDSARYFINRALDRNWVSEGWNVQEFERRFADKFGYRHAIATSSGTDANMCCCASLYDFGAKRGDEIIVPALAFVASASSIVAAGFTPRFVDIELESLNIDPNQIERAITPNARAIMAVHTMGKPCRMDAINLLAKAYHLKVIEDCCEAHGTKYKGKTVGTIGDMGAFSFYTAHLIVCGEGGMVVTDNDEFAGIIRSVKSHGRPRGSNYFDFQRLGFNSKMNDLEAGMGLGELENFDWTLKKRRENMAKLLELTQDLTEYCYFPQEGGYEMVSPHAFWLVLKQGGHLYGCGKLYNYLQEKGIECKTLFGSLPTQHKAFEFLSRGNYPIAEYVGRNGLQFGIHQYLSEDDLVYISETLRGFFR